MHIGSGYFFPFLLHCQSARHILAEGDSSLSPSLAGVGWPLLLEEDRL